MQIRLLAEADAPVLSALHLEALEREPKAFCQQAEEYCGLAREQVASRLRPEPEGDFVLGAFAGEHLVGTAGLWREKGAKRLHRANVWGVYVSPRSRRLGFGKALLTTLIQRAKTYPGLELLALAVTLAQDAARDLALSLGFRPWGVNAMALRVGGEFLDEEHLVLPLHRMVRSPDAPRPQGVRARA